MHFFSGFDMKVAGIWIYYFFGSSVSAVCGIMGTWEIWECT